MGTDVKNGNGQGWKPTTVAGLFVTALLGGFMGWLTGVNSKLDAHAMKILALEAQGIQQGKQLDRIEAKLDRLQEGRKAP